MTPVVVYVGAGTDTRFLARYPDARHVYLDGQPRSEFGTRRCGCAADCQCFARPDFVARLDAAMAAAGRPLAWVDGDVRHYGDRVEYRTNTAVETPADAAAVPPFDVLALAGHDPHGAVLTRAKRGALVCGAPGTVYGAWELGEDTVVARLHHDRAPAVGAYERTDDRVRYASFDAWLRRW